MALVPSSCEAHPHECRVEPRNLLSCSASSLAPPGSRRGYACRPMATVEKCPECGRGLNFGLRGEVREHLISRGLLCEFGRVTAHAPASEKPQQPRAREAVPRTARPAQTSRVPRKSAAPPPEGDRPQSGLHRRNAGASGERTPTPKHPRDEQKGKASTGHWVGVGFLPPNWESRQDAAAASLRQREADAAERRKADSRRPPVPKVERLESPKWHPGWGIVRGGLPGSGKRA